MLQKNPGAVAEVVSQLQPELKAELEQLTTGYFGGSADQQVALLAENADEIIAYAETGKTQTVRTDTLGFEAIEVPPVLVDPLGALSAAERTVTVEGPKGTFEWTLVNAEQAVYRPAGSSGKQQGPIAIGGLGDDSPVAKAPR